MKRSLIFAIALALAVFCAGCDVIETALLPSATPKATATPTPPPTPEPTPAPTPEPVFTETTLNSPLFAVKKVTVTVMDIRFSENYMTAIDLSVENASSAAVSLQLGGVCLNRWQVDGVLENAEAIAPGETRRSTIVVDFQNDPGARFMNLGYIAEMTLQISMTQDYSGETLLKQKNFVVPVPDVGPVGDPTQNTRIVYEDEALILYLQEIDGSLQNVRLVLFHKPDAVWKSANVYPLYAGYTTVPHRNVPLMAGKYRLITLDGADVMARQGISALKNLDLYLSLTLFDGRLTRPVTATIADPKVSETAMNAQDASPIVYQSALPYCILRNKGITQYEGHEALLLDLENITQVSGSLLYLTASASNPEITIDGTAYPLMTYCTNAYPATHGCLLLWPDGAPEGTLTNAKSVTIGLRISRINGGKLEPVLDTQNFSFDLQ